MWLHNMEGGRELGDAVEDVSQGNIMEYVTLSFLWEEECQKNSAFKCKGEDTEEL